MSKNATVSFNNCYIQKETKLAILVKFEDREEPIWIPQSQVHDDSEIWVEGDKGKLVVYEWIAIKNGLV
jgi:hypothetical protein